jgi:DNA processing protein
MVKITIENEKYPDKLRKIKNPPKQLYLEGNIELLNENIVSIIGSRNCTPKGRELAGKFAEELSYQGLVIGSGMAKGIDAAAHIGTIEAGGKTIAVLGNGFNNIFPKENENLYHKILETGGLILTEYPPETEPSSSLFLERNRIVSRNFYWHFSGRSSI